MFGRKKTPQPTPARRPARGAHSDESARTHAVRPRRGLERKHANRLPVGSFEPYPEYEGTRAEFDARSRNHPQLDRCWPQLGGSRTQGRRGPV